MNIGWRILILLIIFTILRFGTRYIFQSPFAEPVLTAQLTLSQEKEIDAYLGGVNLLITLATLVFGGVAFYFDATRKITDRRTGKLLIALSAICAGISIWFGYYATQSIVWMLSSNFFDLDNSVVSGFRLAQGYTFFFALACFGWAFLDLF